MFCHYTYNIEGPLAAIRGRLLVEFDFIAEHGIVDAYVENFRVLADSGDIIDGNDLPVATVELLTHEQRARWGRAVSRFPGVRGDIAEACEAAGREQSTPDEVGYTMADKGIPRGHVRLPDTER